MFSFKFDDDYDDSVIYDSSMKNKSLIPKDLTRTDFEFRNLKELLIQITNFSIIII